LEIKANLLVKVLSKTQTKKLVLIKLTWMRSKSRLISKRRMNCRANMLSMRARPDQSTLWRDTVALAEAKRSLKRAMARETGEILLRRQEPSKAYLLRMLLKTSLTIP
jgi:hypothetical protein